MRRGALRLVWRERQLVWPVPPVAPLLAAVRTELQTKPRQEKSQEKLAPLKSFACSYRWV
jgi:hypothetical protein